jgi:hypothetical protein
VTRLIRGGTTPTSVVRDRQDLELPELRDTESPVTVRLSRSSREAMKAEAFALTGRDNLECGGFLFGPVARSWNREVEITHATTTGAGAIRRNGSLRMDISRFFRTPNGGSLGTGGTTRRSAGSITVIPA